MKNVLPFLLLCLALHIEAKTTPVFYIECPSDVTVDCNDEIWDLSIYGQAYIYGYGDPEPATDPEENYYLNSCNVGTITRTWTATDYSGNTYSCTQTITVESDADYNNLNIQWPEDYQVDACHADLQPENLSPPYDYPSWDQLSCAMIMKNYKDKVFKVGEGCEKILREWTLIDWCNYDPNDPSSQGIWKHTQVLKIMSTEKPEIVCIPDLTVSAGSNCNSTYFDLEEVTAMNNCNSSIEITNNSPYADSNGPDASGYYPLGTFMIKFTARDACGNESICKVKLTVVDQKKPVPICIHGISATLGIQPNGYYVRLFPELFDKGSYDNCTPKADLKIEVEPEILTCDDLDTTPVKVIVTDKNGNSNYCLTYVYLTDNNDKCPQTGTFTLSGSVNDVQGHQIPGIELGLKEKNSTTSILVDDNGLYHFQGLQLDKEYELNYVFDDPETEGWSTLDQIMIKDIIKGDYQLNIASGIASADIDGDGNVSAYDAWMHKQYMLGNMQFNGNWESWTLINKDIVLQNRTDVPNELFDLVVKENVDGSTLNKDLLLLKKGDLDASAIDKIAGRGSKTALLNSNIMTLSPSNVNKVYLTFNEVIDLLGYQYTLKFDKSKVKSIKINYSDVSQLSLGDFGFSKEEEGIILCSFINEEVLTFSDEDIFLSLSIEVDEEVPVHEALDLTNDYLKSEMYLPDYSQRDLRLNSTLTNSSRVTELEIPIQVYPNPIVEHTFIEFTLPSKIKAAHSSIVFMSLDGKRILEAPSANIKNGQNKIQVPNIIINKWPDGIFILRLITPQGTVSKRIVKN